MDQPAEMKADSAITCTMNPRPSASSWPLTEECVLDLSQARETASSMLGETHVIVDLTDVGSIDAAGRELLDTWSRIGVRLAVTTSEAQARLASMTGTPIDSLEALAGPLLASNRPVEVK